jgi:hypothetical protein
MEVKPPAGEPDVGKPPIQFGGWRDTDQCIVPIFNLGKTFLKGVIL